MFCHLGGHALLDREYLIANEKAKVAPAEIKRDRSSA
jgi:hypothetical protein